MKPRGFFPWRLRIPPESPKQKTAGPLVVRHELLGPGRKKVAIMAAIIRMGLEIVFSSGNKQQQYSRKKKRKRLVAVKATSTTEGTSVFWAH